MAVWSSLTSPTLQLQPTCGLNDPMSENIQRTLGRIESKLDHVIATNRHLDKRLNNLEHFKTKLMAVAAVASSVVSIAWGVASQYLFYKA